MSKSNKSSNRWVFAAAGVVFTLIGLGLVAGAFDSISSAGALNPVLAGGSVLAFAVALFSGILWARNAGKAETAAKSGPQVAPAATSPDSAAGPDTAIATAATVAATGTSDVVAAAATKTGEPAASAVADNVVPIAQARATQTGVELVDGKPDIDLNFGDATSEDWFDPWGGDDHPAEGAAEGMASKTDTLEDDFNDFVFGDDDSGSKTASG